jgi:hypothetical protein
MVQVLDVKHLLVGLQSVVIRLELIHRLILYRAPSPLHFWRTVRSDPRRGRGLRSRHRTERKQR